MSLSQKKMISMGFMVAALVAAIVAKGEVLGKLWFVLIMIGLILNVVWLRCPHCGMFLGKNTWDRCNACGGKIDWHDKNAKFTRKKENAEVILKASGEILDDEPAEEGAEEMPAEETGEE